MTRIAPHQSTRDVKQRQVGVDPAPAMRARLAAGIAMTVFSLVIIGGMPLFLYHVVGSRWPDRGPVLNDFEVLHLRSDTELLFGAIAVVGWGLWVVFTVMVAYAVTGAIVDTLRWGIAAETWRDASNPVRWLTGLLIGAIAAIWPAAAHATPPEPVDQTVATRTLTEDELAATTNDQTAEPADQTADEETGVHTHLVQSGETLWSLAQHYYGAPTRYLDLFEANQGRTFADGRTLTHPGDIHPGWDLTIPTTDHAQPGAADSQVTHVVQPGETLWSLAEQYFGDGDRYGEIFEANQGRAFPNGGELTKARHIEPGWELTIPTASAGTEPHEELEDGQGEPGSQDDRDQETLGPDTELDGEGDVTTPEDPTEPATGDPEPETAGDTPAEIDSPPNHRADDPETTAGPGNAGPDSALPFGVWIAAGTSLAATTVVAIAARLRRRRSRSTTDTPSLQDDQPLTGRLSDLEAVIEAEQHRITDLAGEPEPDPAPVIGTDAETEPVALSDLAPAGLGLLGPGQRPAARAAVLTAAAAGQPVFITTGAELGLDVSDDHASAVRIVPDLTAALAEAAGTERPVLVCAESDFDDANRPEFDRFTKGEDRCALVLGEWEPATATLAADGTVKHSTGNAADLDQGVLHTADAATATTLVDLLDGADPIPGQAEPEDDTSVASSGNQKTGSGEQDPAAEQPLLRLCLFGSPEVYLGDKPVPLKKGRRARTFLAVLALADGPIGREELLEAVVGDQTDHDLARGNLNTIGTDTRKNLREATGQKDAKFYTYDSKTKTYRLEIGRFSTDLADFDTAEQAAALTDDPGERAQSLEAALEVYTDDLAPDIDTDDIAELRGQYRAAAHRACRTLADHYARQGDQARADRYAARTRGLKPPVTSQ